MGEPITEDYIKRFFPRATEINISSPITASWKVEERQYYVTGWYISAMEGKEDWGSPGETLEDVMIDAAANDWADHGIMIT